MRLFETLHARTLVAALKAMIVLTLFIALIYTPAVTLVGQGLFHDQANGSLITDSQGKVIGSRYIGQSFLDKKGRPLVRYFQSRPSVTTDAQGKDLPYNAGSSGGSNLGTSDATLLQAIRQRRAAVAKLEKVSPDKVPADAVTASASGLDYQISPAYASLQVNRVARARHMSPASVEALVQRYTSGRGLGFIGDPGVNVVLLNAALDRMR